MLAHSTEYIVGYAVSAHEPCMYHGIVAYVKSGFNTQVSDSLEQDCLPDIAAESGIPARVRVSASLATSSQYFIEHGRPFMT